MTPSGIPRLPWRAILLWVIGAGVLAWVVGFTVGSLVRLMAGA